jgi:GxxExxY protein
MLNKVTSVLSPQAESFVSRTIGCAIRVHKELGPGYLEGIYHDAMGIELDAEGLQYQREVAIHVLYRGKPLRLQRLDLVVEKQIVVELKAVERLDRVHQMQLLSYMKAASLKVGLLMNFHSEFLPQTLRRFVL